VNIYHKSETYVTEAWGFNIIIEDNDCDDYPYSMQVESYYIHDGSTDDMALSDCFETLAEAFNALGDTINEAVNMCELKQIEEDKFYL
jgi:hypothetical protein